MNLSFSGCGFLGIYHIGVASCFKEHAPRFLDSGKLLGASAGAITGCCFICGCCLGECTSFVLRLATKARSRTLGPLHPSFDINRILRDALNQVLPSDAHKIVSGRLFVSLTRVSDKQNVIVSEFDSRDELIQALLCSAFVPFYSGLVPPKFRGVRYVDGGLSDNLPILDEDTVTVSPFAGESDICPSDNSSNFLHITLVNTSLQFTSGNLYRLSHALFPPHPQVLSEMCRQGFDDALCFLQSRNLISCTRHLTVMSCISTSTEKTHAETKEMDVVDGGSEEKNSEEDECEECKKKLHGALIDSLPPSVMMAFQAACDSVNKGLINYLYSTMPVKLIAIAAVPWILPIEITYNVCVKFLQWLPSMPHDVQAVFQKTIDLLRAILKRILHHHPRYSARFTCQLAITEVHSSDERSKPDQAQSGQRAVTQGYSQGYSHSHVLNYPDPNKPVIRNFNIGFAVDFNSSKPDSVQSLQQLEGHIDRLKVEDIHIEQSSPAGDLVYHPRVGHHESGTATPCQEIFDTFEQCLHITNQMESALSYYYQDENNKGCYKFEEIFSVSDANLTAEEHVRPSEMSTETENDVHGSISEADLSWDSFLEMKPEIEDELEALIESALSIPHLET